MERADALGRLLVPATAAERDVLVERLIPCLDIADLVALLCAPPLQCQRVIHCSVGCCPSRQLPNTARQGL